MSLRIQIKYIYRFMRRLLLFNFCYFYVFIYPVRQKPQKAKITMEITKT